MKLDFMEHNNQCIYLDGEGWVKTLQAPDYFQCSIFSTFLHLFGVLKQTEVLFIKTKINAIARRFDAKTE